MTHTTPFTCAELGKRLDEIGLPNDLHLRDPNCFLRLYLDGDCMIVRDIAPGRVSVDFLPSKAPIEPNELRD